MGKIKYRYTHEKFTDLITKVSVDPQGWVAEKLNEIGSSGRRVLGFPLEIQEASGLRDGNGNVIPKYGIVVLVEETYVDETEPEADL